MARKPTDLTLMRTGLPHWLAPRRSSDMTPLNDADISFVLDEMIKGYTVKSILRDNPGLPDYARFMRYVMNDPELEDRYYEAKRIQTETYGEKMVEVAEAEESMEDVQRSRLKVDTYKWLMSVNNRKRYGDSKNISINGNIDIRSAMSNADERVLRVRRGVTIDHEE